MRITEKTLMKDFPKISLILKLSDVDLLEDIKKFDVPKQILGIEVENDYKVSMNDLICLWDAQSEEKLLEYVVDAYLKNTTLKELKFNKKIKSIDNMPLIDTLRLVQSANDLIERSGKMFKQLQRKSDDSRVEEITSKYKGSSFGIIARFCYQFPVYTIEQAKKVSWYEFFLAFEEKTKENDINNEVMKLKPLEA